MSTVKKGSDKSAAEECGGANKVKKITVRIPKRWKGDGERFIACNGKRVLVKTGVDVALDPDIAEVYFNSEAQRTAAERRASELVSE